MYLQPRDIAMTEPIYEFGDRFTVGLFGPERQPAREIATLLGADSEKICLIKPASNDTHPGFLEIMNPAWGQPESSESSGFDIYADGCELTEPGTALVLFTADCPTVVFICRLKNGQIRMIAVHAGRAAMKPTTLGDGSISNIITKAYRKLVDGFDVDEVQVYITGAICGQCFLHDRPEAQLIAAPFEQFGEHAFIDREKGTLNLVEIIRRQLIQLGVSENKIKHDGICTKENDWLASYRRTGTTERNAVVVVLL